MKSIRAILVTIIILIVAISLVTSNFIGVMFITQTYEERIEHNHQVVANAISQNVSTFIERIYDANRLVAMNPDVESINAAKQQVVIDRAIENFPEVDMFFLQDATGMQTAKSYGTPGDRSTRWWFVQYMEERNPFVGKSYFSLANNMPMISAFYPIEKNGQFNGLSGVDIKLGALQEMVERYSLGTGGFSYIIDGEGAVIAHIDENQVLEIYNYKTLERKAVVYDSSGNPVLDEKGAHTTEIKPIEISNELKEITNKALNGESGFVKYENLEGQTVYSAYQPIVLPGVSDSWAVFTVQTREGALTFIGAVQKILVTLVIAFALISSLIAFYLATRITKPIVYIAGLMSKASEGDLTVQSTYRSKTEIGSLSSSFNIMIENMKGLIKQINQSADLVSDSSSHLAEITGRTEEVIEESAKSIEDVSKAAESEAEDVEKGLVASKTLSEELDVVANHIEDGKQSSSNIHEVNQDGLSTVKSLKEISEKSSTATMEVADVVNQLSEKARAIEEIADAITSIAEQTNLLALNAAIEAARAGDAGKGFAVVADEVRKLAEGTSKSSNDVKDIISTILSDIKLANDTIEYNKSVVTQQNEIVDNTESSFNKINLEAETVVQKISIISSGLDKVIESRDAMMDILEDVAAVSEETAAATVEISSATSEQKSSVAEISSLTRDLNNLTIDLNNMLKKFKI